jgi:ribosome recycling factor
MTEELEMIKLETESSMKKAISHLEAELLKIRAGKANPTMLDGIFAEYYGSPTPIAQIANISVLDARTISVQPWEKNMLQPIERAIIASNIGINPQNDGNFIRLSCHRLRKKEGRNLLKGAMEKVSRLKYR